MPDQGNVVGMGVINIYLYLGNKKHKWKCMVRQGIEPGILASAIQADIHGPSSQNYHKK